MTTFNIKPQQKFRLRQVCFTFSELNGRYEQKGDTLFFSDMHVSDPSAAYEKFAVLKRKSNQSYHFMVLFRSESDTTGLRLEIVKNQLFD